ncbi:MAG: hypothetical protein V3V18_05175 [Methylococcales bacterium]
MGEKAQHTVYMWAFLDHFYRGIKNSVASDRVWQSLGGFELKTLVFKFSG